MTHVYTALLASDRLNDCHVDSVSRKKKKENVKDTEKNRRDVELSCIYI